MCMYAKNTEAYLFLFVVRLQKLFYASSECLFQRRFLLFLFGRAGRGGCRGCGVLLLLSLQFTASSTASSNCVGSTAATDMISLEGCAVQYNCVGLVSLTEESFRIASSINAVAP